MTDLEIARRAKYYMDKLARGIDPFTDREISEDSCLNQPRLIRCFFYVSDILEQVIGNGGSVGSKQKLHPFSISPEQLSRVQISNEPIRITQLTERIYACADDPQMKKLSATVITDWLLAKGFLEKRRETDGKTVRIPTELGNRIGLWEQTYQGRYGAYHAVLYSADAQRFVLEHFMDML